MFPFTQSMTHCGEGDDCIIDVHSQSKPFTMVLSIKSEERLSCNTLFCSEETMKRIAREIDTYFFNLDHLGENGEIVEELAHSSKAT